MEGPEERWWSTVRGGSAARSKVVATGTQVLHFELTGEHAGGPAIFHSIIISVRVGGWIFFCFRAGIRLPIHVAYGVPVVSNTRYSIAHKIPVPNT